MGLDDAGLTGGPAAPMLELAGVSRTFRSRQGTVEALRGVDLRVPAGEFVAVIGRSGCGKSTLLRLIAGLSAPTSGEVRVEGRRVTAPRRDVAVMFQRAALLPWRSALDNVLLPVEMLGRRRDEHLDRARQLLGSVGLEGFAHRLPHELSGGMQQRVALCRALIQRPDVLLMDEPFSALDALTREELCVELQRIHATRRTTTVLVTHSIQEAVMLADRVVVLTERPGRVRQVLPIELPRPRSLDHPDQVALASRYVAELHTLLVPASSPSTSTSTRAGYRSSR